MRYEYVTSSRLPTILPVSYPSECLSSLFSSFATKHARIIKAPTIPIIVVVVIIMVPVGGVAPPSRVYESLVLTLELHRHIAGGGKPRRRLVHSTT
jgi:hypothetical protein